jgi:glutathione synthase/RimK-type ligase-like ATP-grasp enzyme
MRFSKAVDQFHLLPPASKSYDQYRDALISIAQSESATLFIPVSGAGSSVEDARAAETMSSATKGKCRTFIQDPETMLDLHDKDRFMALVKRLGFTIPTGQMVQSVDQAIGFLKKDGQGTKYILKCMGLDENRGDMTLFPLEGDKGNLSKSRQLLEGLTTQITFDCPYVFQEFIPGPGKSHTSYPSSWSSC